MTSKQDRNIISKSSLSDQLSMCQRSRATRFSISWTSGVSPRCPN